MTEKTGPRNSTIRFYNHLLLRAGATPGEKFIHRSVIVEVGLALK
jgi:hypothetical protein